MSKHWKLRSPKLGFGRGYLYVILAAFAIAPTVAYADEIAIGTINVTDGVVTGFPTSCYLVCGEAGATNNLSDTSLIWQSAIFFDNRVPLTTPSQWAQESRRRPKLFGPARPVEFRNSGLSES